MLEGIGNSIVAAEEYNKFPTIEEVNPVDDSDLDCLRDVRDVLARHGKLDRFGVNLLHKHFDLREGEVMVETTDEVARAQTLMPAHVSKVGDTKLVQTNFYLAKGDAFMSCLVTCVFSNGSHRQSHVTFSG